MAFVTSWRLHPFLMICLAASSLAACSSKMDVPDTNVTANGGSPSDEQAKVQDEAAEAARQASAEDLKEGSAEVNAEASADEDPADANTGDAATNH